MILFSFYFSGSSKRIIRTKKKSVETGDSLNSSSIAVRLCSCFNDFIYCVCFVLFCFPSYLGASGRAYVWSVKLIAVFNTNLDFKSAELTIYRHPLFHQFLHFKPIQKLRINSFMPRWLFYLAMLPKLFGLVHFEYRGCLVSFYYYHSIAKTHQIYWKFNHTKYWKFSTKTNLIFFIFLPKNIDCGSSLEPPRQGGSNEYLQSMFLSRNKNK